MATRVSVQTAVRRGAHRVRGLPWTIRGRNRPMSREFVRNNHSWVERLSESASPSAAPAPTAPVRLYALLGTWNEDDIVYATVRNAFEQGAQRVFVLDDESDDDTCSEAEAAGAEVLRFSNEGWYNVGTQMSRYRDVINEQTRLAGAPVWWLIIDADEFVVGPDGSTVAEFIAGLDPRVDVVGCRVLDHYPSGEADYIPRTNPVAVQPLARWRNHPCCPWGHWKHSLVCLREPDSVRVLGGYHRHRPREGMMIEPEQSLLMHHIQFRNRVDIEQKLDRAYAPGGRLAGRSTYYSSRLRYENLDLVYRQQWHSIRSVFPGGPRYGMQLEPWQTLVPETERRHQNRDAT